MGPLAPAAARTASITPPEGTTTWPTPWPASQPPAPRNFDLDLYTRMDWVCGPDIDAPAAAESARADSVDFRGDWQRRQFASYVASGAGRRPPWSY